MNIYIYIYIYISYNVCNKHCAPRSTVQMRRQMRRAGPVGRAAAAKEPGRHAEQACDSSDDSFEVVTEATPTAPPTTRTCYVVLAAPGAQPCKCLTCWGADCTDLRGIHTSELLGRESVALAGVTDSFGHLSIARGHRVLRVDCEASRHLELAFERYAQLGPLHEAPAEPKLHFW